MILTSQLDGRNPDVARSHGLIDILLGTDLDPLRILLVEI
jgi:hypothetical protein